MPFTLAKPYPRLWSLDAGVAMVVTDLHGDWDAYQRYRDRFVDLQAKGRADCLVFTGDLIHRESPTAPDHSLEIVLDVLALQATYGEVVIYLCGNHELPHIYGFGLSKGAREYTPGFEAVLSQSSHRSTVVNLFYTLPFFVRTAAGVSLTHAGTSAVMTDAQSMSKLFRWSHREQLAQAGALLADQDIAGLQRAYAMLSLAESYDALARHYLAVTGPDDPRYNDLLRGLFATTSPDYRLVRSALFTRCEQEYGVAEYSILLAAMLQHLSAGYVPQQVLVAGHMAIPNGYQVIAEQHLRLASACHATPREAGLYLLFGTARPIEGIADLLAGLYSVYQAA
jgi:hypothetical protein